MACLEMYNNSSLPPHSHPHSQASSPSPPPLSPRISFSNDFVESHNSHHFSRSEAPASLDFEFSVSNSNMLTSADELFSKGKLLPFKDGNGSGSGNCNSQMQRTLRDQLLVNDDDIFSLKPPKAGSSSSSSNRWKGFLGLRKSHIGSKKPEKIDASSDSVKRFPFSLEDPNLTQSPQDMMSTEGSNSCDMEMGI